MPNKKTKTVKIRHLECFSAIYGELAQKARAATICTLFYNTFISFQELCMSLRFLPLCPANPVISANICYQTLHHIWWE